MIVRLTEAARVERAPRAIALGNFDGVHKGHQAIVRAMVASARARSLEPALVTFAPHPAAVIGAAAPPLLTTLARKAELVERLGVPIVFVQSFDAAFATWSPERFARELILEALGAKAIFVGDNFRFGAGRAGDLATLKALGAELGFEAYGFGVLSDARGPLSSSRARAEVAAGEAELAAQTLGRPHAISGVVARGDQRGRTIGFPTANLEDVAEAVPPHGVYAVLVDELTGGGAHALARGVMNVGVRPTVAGEARRTIEAHLFEVARDLYGASLRVHLVARLREERKFAGLAELRAQIAADAKDAAGRLATFEPGPSGAFG